MWLDVYPGSNDWLLYQTCRTNAKSEQCTKGSVGEFVDIADVLHNLADQKHYEADDESG